MRHLKTIPNEEMLAKMQVVSEKILEWEKYNGPFIDVCQTWPLAEWREYMRSVGHYYTLITVDELIKNDTPGPYPEEIYKMCPPVYNEDDLQDAELVNRTNQMHHVICTRIWARFIILNPKYFKEIKPCLDLS